MRPHLAICRRLAPLAFALPAALPAQRHCAPASVPDPLPMVMQLVDSAALAAALPKAILPPTTFSLWYGPNGQLTHVMALTDSLVAQRAAPADSAAVARAQLATLVGGVAFPLDSGKPVTLRLTVGRDSAGAVSLAVDRSVACSPVARHRYDPNLPVNVTRDDIEELRHATLLVATVRIDAAGHTHDIDITQSSHSRLMDDDFRQSLERATYDPATADGFPTEVTLQIRALPPRVEIRQGQQVQSRP